MFLAKLILLLVLAFSISKVKAIDYFSYQLENESTKRYVIFDMDSYIESGLLFAPKSVKLFQNLSRDKSIVLHFKVENPNTLLKLKADYPGILKAANSISKSRGQTSDICSEQNENYAYLKTGKFQNSDGACNSFSALLTDLSSDQNIHKLATKLHYDLVSQGKGNKFSFKGRSRIVAKQYPGDMLLDLNIPLGLKPTFSSGRKDCHLYDSFSGKNFKNIPMSLCIKYAHIEGLTYKMVKNEAGISECFEVLGSKARNVVDKIFCTQSFRDFHAFKYDLHLACTKAYECKASDLLNNINTLGPILKALNKLINEVKSIKHELEDWPSRKIELVKSIDQMHQQLDNCLLTSFEAKVASSSNPSTELQQDYQRIKDNLIDTFKEDLGGALDLSSSKDDLMDYLVKVFNQCGEDYFKIELLNRESLDHCADKAKNKALEQFIHGLADDAKHLDPKCYDLNFKHANAMNKYNFCIGSLSSLKEFRKVKDLAKKLNVDIAQNVLEDFNKCIKGKLGVNNCPLLVLGKKSLLSAPEVTKAFSDMPQGLGIVYNKKYKNSFEKCLLKAGAGAKSNKVEIDSCIDNYKRKLVNFTKKQNSSDESYYDDYKAYKKAVLSLAGDLSTTKKTLSRDISAFHWTDFSSASVIPRGYTFAKTKMFGANLDPDGNVVGKGLYAAVDPESTKQYGDKLIQLNVKEGGKFLDLRENDCAIAGEFYISNESKELMKRAGCKMPDTKINCYSRNSFFKPGPDRCHNILMGAIKELDISFIAYKYGASLPSFCKSRSSNVAFVMVKTPKVQDTYDLSDIYSDDAFGSIKKIKKSTKRYKKYSGLGNISYHFSNALEDFKKNDDKTLCDKWGSRLFGCNCSKNYTYPEDQTSKSTD